MSQISLNKFIQKNKFNLGLVTLKENIISKITTPRKYQYYLSKGIPILNINVSNIKKEIIEYEVGINIDKNLKLKSDSLFSLNFKKLSINALKLYKDKYSKKIILDKFCNDVINLTKY